MKLRFLFLLLAIGLYTISACTSAPTPSPEIPRSLDVALTPSIVPPIATAPAARQPTAEQAASSISFPKGAGLGLLDSYTYSLRVIFKGTREGVAIDRTDLYTRTFSLNPPAQFTMIQTTADDGKPVTLMNGFMNGVKYSRAGADEPCNVQMASSISEASFNPVSLLTPIVHGNEKGRETINDVPVRHYVMDSLNDVDTRMSGEVWIADPGTFVVKYDLRVQGGEAYFGKGNVGEQGMAFELRDVGAKKPPAIPSGCPLPTLDLPMMADAANVSRSLFRLSYTTSSGITATMGFYREQMKALGWSVESESVTDAEPINTQPPPGMSALPNLLPTLLPNLKQLPPGINLKDYLPTAVPTRRIAAPISRDGWMFFARAGEERHAYIMLRLVGAGVRVELRLQ